MKLAEKGGDAGGRWKHNTFPQANTKAPEPRAGQWVVGWGLAAPILHLPLLRQGEVQRLIRKTENKQSYRGCWGSEILWRREIIEEW